MSCSTANLLGGPLETAVHLVQHLQFLHHMKSQAMLPGRLPPRPFLPSSRCHVSRKGFSIQLESFFLLFFKPIFFPNPDFNFVDLTTVFEESVLMQWLQPILV